ncbi:MAG TPA: pirin family protein [Actinomycetota bacterium]|nr:pirin family protein [Actinomycetota bacterium]
MTAIKLTTDRYHRFGPEDFGAPGLVALESIGPAAEIAAFGPLVAVHDSTFEPNSGIGHHPHRGMERLFYILEGTVDHDDSLNSIQGHMGTGDLGILTEGERGMLHSEWNNTSGRARAYIFVYPTDPTPPTASFDAVRDGETKRLRTGPGAEVKQVIDRGPRRVRGDLRELADVTLDAGASYHKVSHPGEPSLLFVVDGDVVVHLDDEAYDAGPRETVLVPATNTPNEVHVDARAPSRIIHAITGPGFGLVRREDLR